MEAASEIDVARAIGHSHRSGPRGSCQNYAQDRFDISQGSFEPPHPKNTDEIYTTFEQSVREVEQYLKGMSEQVAQESWRLMLKDRELFNKPRIAVLRSIMLNHWYHHRGQLSVYLRLLDIPVPIIYGRSADENPSLEAIVDGFRLVRTGHAIG